MNRFPLYVGMPALTLILALALFLAATSSALGAGCIYEGRLHPEGTRIGVLVCDGGKWVPRR